MVGVGVGFLVRTLKFRRLGNRDLHTTAQIERLLGATSRKTTRDNKGWPSDQGIDGPGWIQ